MQMISQFKAYSAAIDVLYRIVRWFATELGIKLNPFKMDDPNTFYYVNGRRTRTIAAEANPDVLGYRVRPSEKHKSADELLQQALQKVRKKQEKGGWMDSKCIA